MQPVADQYNRYRHALKGESLPCAFVDLSHFDRNIETVAEALRYTGKFVRIHSKSLRCPTLIRRILDRGGPLFQGVMTFHMRETAFLAEQGFDDFIVAYPSFEKADLEAFAKLTCRNVCVRMMVDSIEHLDRLEEIGRRFGTVLKTCLEIDLSYRPAGSTLHLGMRRSPIRTPKDAAAFAKHALSLSHVAVVGLMGYEAHIAGPNDAVPHKALKNTTLRLIKRLSIHELTLRRDAVVEELKRIGLALEIVNGGGSGSLVDTSNDPYVTEITAGSAFYAPALFWHYSKVSFVPSAFFAIPVVRRPAKDIITCLGGGYVASGPAGKDKLPVPIYPEGLSLLSLEGAGEVQTPLKLSKNTPELGLGAPVIFQHAKAGELCERFHELALISGNNIVDRVKTYRGEGIAYM